MQILLCHKSVMISRLGPPVFVGREECMGNSTPVETTMNGITHVILHLHYQVILGLGIATLN